MYVCKRTYGERNVSNHQNVLKKAVALWRGVGLAKPSCMSAELCRGWVGSTDRLTQKSSMPRPSFEPRSIDQWISLVAIPTYRTKEEIKGRRKSCHCGINSQSVLSFLSHYWSTLCTNEHVCSGEEIAIGPLPHTAYKQTHIMHNFQPLLTRRTRK